MALDLKQSRAVNDLASALYDFLPGKPHPYADQSISFEGIANDLRLGGLWPGGSKLPAVTRFIGAVLEKRPNLFPNLMTEIVKRGMTYRTTKGNDFTREDVEEINKLVAKLNFKIQELHDKDFLDSLPSTTAPSGVSKSYPYEELRALLKSVMKAPTPQKRGYEFEAFLSRLFHVFELAPKEAFRITGEQIDGSFQFDGETYLLEATWRNERVGGEELGAFLTKVVGKAHWSRGLHISYTGYTADGLQSFAIGKATRIVCMDGLDINDMLSREMPVPTILARKVRHAAETNESFAAVRDLFA